MAIKKKYKFLIFVVILLALGYVFYAFFLRIVQIGNDEVGVRVELNNSQVDVVRGDLMYMPLRTRLYIYPATIQAIMYEDSVRVAVKDGILFYLLPRISYQLNAGRADLFYEKCGKTIDEINKVYLKELVYATYAKAASGYTADSLIYNKQQFEQLANEELKAKMDDVGLILKTSNSNLSVPKQIQDIVNLRVQALQDAIVAEMRLRQVDAQRREDSLRNSALTPLSIQKAFIDKWDGKFRQDTPLPKVYKDITE